MDFWPLSDPLLYILDPQVAQQVTVENSQPKFEGLKYIMHGIAGPGDMVSSDGPYWKKWRSIMNPGFAAGHLMSLVPGIIDDCLVFCDNLRKRAEKNEVFRMEDDATKLTVDIIGKVALDLKLNAQTGKNELVEAFREQVQLLPNDQQGDPFSQWKPYGIWRRWVNSRKMVDYIGKVLDERFARSGEASATEKGARKQRKRAIIDLALDAYQAQQMGLEEGAVQHKAPVMDAEFRRQAIVQIRTFIFAGHDTTSSTIAYAFYELHRNPATLEHIRHEHDQILGPVSQTAKRLRDDPHLINKLEYTNAVVKETLRLWPAASSARTGMPGFMIREPKTGMMLPTEGYVAWVVPYGIHRYSKIWGKTVASFIPDRFMPENESSLPENAWRPFEKGPRNCIGQELAMIEARVILALTCRSFEFTPAFDAVEELKNDGSAYAGDDRWRKGVMDLDGEEAWPVLIGTAKPREGMPCRVKIRPSRVLLRVDIMLIASLPALS
ncbi:hypothetical protein LTR86_002833 [Recurvomyces mirabilis]|nr:hypothetical protein LTR86_002833 [Recurvomyces mirabilis]